ncbi:MAG: glycosyltransferase family 9 protein, partial [Candidatus Omnitrophica bacterium]|nr:glycosyltransferase family 9 protein [Candidatus Omnitrophota bacterium]
MRNKDTVKKVLVVRNDRFGEFLLNIPAFRAIKESFVNAKITAAVNPSVSELAGCVTYLDEIIELPHKKRSWKQILSLAEELQKKNFDLAVILNPSKDLHIATFIAGIPVRVGYSRKCGFFLTHRIKDQKHLALKHEVEYNLELVNLIGASTADLNLGIRLPQDAKVEPDKDLIAVHPWTSDPVKQWPLNNFVDLVKRLTGSGFRVAVVGGKEEEPRSKELFENINSSVNSFTGKTSLKELAVLLKKARLLISGDSGPVHLACCVNTPVVAVFRNDLPGKTAKRWGPWGKANFVIEKSNLADI